MPLRWGWVIQKPVALTRTGGTSEPETHAGNPACFGSLLAGGAREIRALAELARPLATNMGPDLARHFKAQPQAGRAIGEAAADIPRLVASAIYVDLDTRLQDELLREQEFVFRPQTQRGSSVVAHVGGRIDFEPVGCEALNTEGQPPAVRSDPAVVAHAQLRVPEGGHRVSPEYFGSGVLQLASGRVTFCFEHQAVVIPAEPGLCVVRRGVAITGIDTLQSIDPQRAEAGFVGQAQL